MGALARAEVARREHATERHTSGQRVIATRRHGAVDAPRALVRATVGIEASPRPALSLVPRRRRAARFVVVMTTLVGLAMLGAAAFQTQLAQRQLEVDRLDSAISSSREQYDVLRRERAALRAPARLSEFAVSRGMLPDRDSSFVTVDASVLATVQQSTGTIDRAILDADDSLLDQFREVKAVTDGAP